MNRQVFTAKPHQVPMINHIVGTLRCMLAVPMGAGKTSAVLTVLDALYNVEGETHPTLVLAPRRVALTVWPAEAKKWAHLSLDVSPILGTVAERLAALRRNGPIYTMNYDNLPWLVERYGARWPFRTIVADESTRLKSFRTRQGGKRAKAIGSVIHKHVSRVIDLTGTPAPNGLKDLWGQIWMLDAGERLGRSYSAFMGRWFQQVPGGDGYTQVRPLAHAQAEIQDKLRDLCLTIDLKDWMDVKDPIVRPVYVDLPAKARALYREMEKKMFCEIEKHGVEAVNAAAKTQKCLQLASGAVYVDPLADSDRNPKSKLWKEVHSEKLDALDSILAEAAGMPLLVAYHFKSDLARLLKAFPQGRELDADHRTIEDWNAGRIPLLFAHPASAGHGLNLQDGGNIIVFFTHWWNLEEHQQIIERIGPVRQLQSGHDRPVFIYHIIARDTIDEDVVERLASKRDVQDILLQAMKTRRRK